MLDALVHADRAIEHDALPCIACRPLDRHAPEPDRLGTDQDALGIEAVEDDPETIAFGADPVRFGYEKIIDEQHV